MNHQEQNAIHLLEQAVRTLATGPDDVKRRLRSAFMYHLGYVFESHVPREMGPLLASIRERLTRKPRYKGQSTVESALYRMHKSTASKFAVDVFELYLALSRRR